SYPRVPRTRPGRRVRRPATRRPGVFGGSWYATSRRMGAGGRPAGVSATIGRPVREGTSESGPRQTNGPGERASSAGAGAAAAPLEIADHGPVLAVPQGLERRGV